MNDESGEMMDADEYFGTEAPSNPEAVQDLPDSYEPEDNDPDEHEDLIEGEVPEEDQDAGESFTAPEDDEDEPDEDWLIEGRFRRGEEEKVVNSYVELEKFHSKTVNELKEEIAREREAAFRQAKELFATEQSKPTALELAGQRSQLMGLALHDPGSAFAAAVETGDEASINAVLDIIGNGEPGMDIDGDPATAAALRIQYESQKQTSSLQQMREELDRQKAEVNVERGYATFERQNAELLADDDFKAEFGALVGERIHGMNASDPVHVMEFLDDCADRTFGRLARKQGLGSFGRQQHDPPAAMQQTDTHDRNAAKRRAAAETSQPRSAASRRATSNEPTPEEAYADDILGAARIARPMI